LLQQGEEYTAHSWTCMWGKQIDHLFHSPISDNLCHHQPITSLSVASSSTNHHALSNYQVRK
jgi:hypothetical protein